MAEKTKASEKAVRKTTAKSPAKKDTTAKKAAGKKAAPAAKSTAAVPAKPAAPRPRKPKANGGTVTPEQRWRMIAEAAYFRAEQSNFLSDSVRDWLEAEREIDAKLAAG